MSRARKTLAAALLTVVAVGAAASGCTAERANDPRVSEDNGGTVNVTSGIFRISVDQRKVVPTLSGRAVGSDRTVDTADYSGKIIVLNVWGSWCTPCRKEPADLEAAAKQTAKQTQFVGINTRDYAEGPAAAFQRSQDLSYPSIYDPDATQLIKMSSQVPLTSIPSSLIIDKQGRAAVRIIGPITKVTLVDLIDDVAAGK